MTRKAFRPIEVDVDAGTHDDRLYNTVFDGWRANLRNKLLPLVRHETPILASMQVFHHNRRFLSNCLYNNHYRNRFVQVHLIIISFGQPTWALIPSLWYSCLFSFGSVMSSLGESKGYMLYMYSLFTEPLFL